MSENAKNVLLEIANQSLKENCFPSIWKKATIIPILKQGKHPKELGSYRPICLTSCLGKMLERTMKNRMTYLLETNKTLRPEQAGFRRLRSTQDQVLKMTQEISDGLNKPKPGKRTVLCLIDFSRAFDTVWHPGLMHKLLKSGLPMCTVRWIKSFLEDRRTRVRFENANSKYRRFKAGTPQGSVISPLIFLLFINDILDQLPPGVKASLFADDLALWVSDENLEEANRKLQDALNILTDWTRRWKLKINVGKCESVFFSMAPKEARWQPHLTIDNQEIPYNRNPTFLGIKFDRTLSFRPHVENLQAKLQKRMNVLRNLAGRSWGMGKEDLRAVYLTYISSAIEYCGAAYLPATPKTILNKLQVIQNTAARIITGCCRDSPTDLLNVEAELKPITVKSQISAACAYDRSMRLPEDNPSNEPAKSHTRRRLKSQPSWREMAKESLTMCDNYNLPREKLLSVPTIPPWTITNNITVNDELATHCSKRDPVKTRHEAAAKTIASLPEPDVQIWSDGSAEKSIANGGSGVLIFGKYMGETELLVPAGKVSSSYRAEQVALKAGLEWMVQNVEFIEDQRVHMFTDSKSLVKKLKRGAQVARETTEVETWKLLSNCSNIAKHIHIQWIPGHARLASNYAADRIARLASRLEQDSQPIDMSSAQASIKRSMTRVWKRSIHHSQLEEAGKKPPNEKERNLNLSRKDRVTLSQLRTGGHSPLLGSYRKRIGIAEDDHCECGEVDDLNHMLRECPITQNARLELMGPNPTTEILWTEPKTVLEFLRATGRTTRTSTA